MHRAAKTPSAWKRWTCFKLATHRALGGRMKTNLQLIASGLALAGALAYSPAHAALTRCEDGAGKVTYVQGECPSGLKAVREVTTSPAASSEEQRQAQQLAAKEVRAADQLQVQRAKKERADAAEQRKAQQAAAQRSKHCAKLKLHAQRTSEQVARATPAKQEAARRRAQRAADDYAAACPAAR
jgi:hypothetical protein